MYRLELARSLVRRTARRRDRGFTLVELLAVIGIVALLMGVLLPALGRARQQSNTVKCMSNMRQVGMELLNYANNWHGAMFPPGLGYDKPVSNRWPVYVFNPAIYNPPAMLCPSDVDPAYEHSYILNNHLTERHVTYSNTQMLGLTPPEVVVMGEKNTKVPDYYMDGDEGDFGSKVDFFKHGAQYGSNYLFLDIHVETQRPKDATSDIDPWDPAVTLP